jgi:hypothetical protein
VPYTLDDLPSLDELRERYFYDLRHEDRVPVKELEFALWRAGTLFRGDAHPPEAAPHLQALVEACVHEHLDVRRLARDLAALLRESVDLRLGFPVEPHAAWVPRAVVIVREYVHPAPRPPLLMGSLLGW